MFDREGAAAAAEHWISGYLRAWETNDPGDIRALFTDDAEYRDGPATEPWTGHEAIVAGWLGQKDEPGTWSFTHELVAVDGDTAVVRGRTSYPQSTDKSSVYDNLIVLRLAPDGRARSFTDWWIIPDDALTPGED
jgi:ketosteroid isomerase-like protein